MDDAHEALERRVEMLIAADEAACTLIGLLRYAIPEGVEARGRDYGPYRRYRDARAAAYGSRVEAAHKEAE